MALSKKKNRGEWSELYALLHVLATGRIQSGAPDNNEVNDFQVISASRKIDGINHIFRIAGPNVEVLDAAGSTVVTVIPRSQLLEHSELLLSKIKTEMNALESVLKSESQSGFRPVLDEVKADEGFEAALSKALGDTIMASTESDAPAVWSGIGSADNSPAFPAGVQALAPHIKAPEALGIALSYIGFVEDDAQGEAAAAQLKPGQSIVSREGAYWRWDGLRIRAKAMDRNAIRLKNKNRLEELQGELPAAQSASDIAEDNHER